MNCKFHPETESVAFCVSCGDALCGVCRREVDGSVYCETCLAHLIRGRGMGSGRGSASTSGGGDNPGFAFALGLIPGVGAIYNGDFFKAAANIVIFGLLISIVGNARTFEGLFVLLMIGFYFYMPFEAYYTARKRRLKAEGVDLETPIDRFHEFLGGIGDRELWGGVGLVVLGLLFLADTLRLLSLDSVLRLWPVVMIVIGGLLLRRHYLNSPSPGPSRRGTTDRPGQRAGWRSERPDVGEGPGGETPGGEPGSEGKVPGGGSVR